MKQVVKLLVIVSVLIVGASPSVEVVASETMYRSSSAKDKLVESEVGITFDNDYTPSKKKQPSLPQTGSRYQTTYRLLGFSLLGISFYLMREKIKIINIKERK